MTTTTATKNGRVARVIGPVVDVEFGNDLPNIYNALEIKLENGEKLILETAQHVGGNKVRTVAMGATDGLRRGMEVSDTGAPIKVPVGKGTLGRMFNLLGEPIDVSCKLQPHGISCQEKSYLLSENNF